MEVGAFGIVQRLARWADPVERVTSRVDLRDGREAGVTTAVDHGRERHYELASGALAGVRAWLDAVDSAVAGSHAVDSRAVDSHAVQPRFDERHLDALELEAIVWLADGHLTHLLDPSADRWRG